MEKLTKIEQRLDNIEFTLKTLIGWLSPLPLSVGAMKKLWDYLDGWRDDEERP